MCGYTKYGCTNLLIVVHNKWNRDVLWIGKYKRERVPLCRRKISKKTFIRQIAAKIREIKNIVILFFVLQLKNSYLCMFICIT